MCTSSSHASGSEFSSIEYKFGDLPSLYPSAISAIRGALKLDSHFAALNFRHAFLSKVAEFVAIQDHTGCVEGVWLYLHWVLKPHGEGIAGAIGEVLAQVLPQDNPCRLSSILALYSAEPQLEPYSPKPAMNTLLSTANWMLSQRPR